MPLAQSSAPDLLETHLLNYFEAAHEQKVRDDLDFDQQNFARDKQEIKVQKR